jgi:organic hydroperoxide reductase OsmC/OhrA
MGTYTATVSWTRAEQAFTDGKYSRAHVWRFDGGAQVRGSSSPHVVRPPLSDESAVDPEEAFIASLSSCHMLFFLDFARRGGFRIDEYEDRAEGVMAKGADGRMAMTVVTLHPRVAFSGDRMPTREEIDHLHHRSHEECFIANSVKTEVRVEPA